jgi:hypothetical protein
MPRRVDPKMLTPMQTRLLSVLSDGLPHDRADLRANGLGGDEFDSFDNLKQQICVLRRHARKVGLDVICVVIKGAKLGYQLVVTYVHDER